MKDIRRNAGSEGTKVKVKETEFHFDWYRFFNNLFYLYRHFYFYFFYYLFLDYLLDRHLNAYFFLYYLCFTERPKEKEGMSEESIERLISKLTEQPYKEVAATVAY
mgnify:CR=1 FL=1